MKGSYHLATISGIPVQIHWSFGLLFFYVLYVGNSTGMNWQGMGFFALFLLALFVCVVLHEFGHALAARRYGVQTQDIILSPIGGIARLNKLPDKPIQEFVVAIAGPLVNVAIALLLGLGIYFFADGNFIPDDDQRTVFNDVSNFIPMLFLLNIALVGFNLLPAFPMDGGRIFRSLLSIPLGRSKATRIASWLGQGIAILFIFYAIYYSEVMIGFIGLFVFITASREYRMVRTEQLLANHQVSDVMRMQYTLLSARQAMQQAAFVVQHGMEKNFLVANDEEQVFGVLHELFITEAIRTNDLDAPIATYMSPKYEAITPALGLKELVQKIQRNGYSILPVYDEMGQLVAVVDVQGINDFMRLQQKLR